MDSGDGRAWWALLLDLGGRAGYWALGVWWWLVVMGVGGVSGWWTFVVDLCGGLWWWLLAMNSWWS